MEYKNLHFNSINDYGSLKLQIKLNLNSLQQSLLFNCCFVVRMLSGKYFKDKFKDSVTGYWSI